MSDDPGRLTRIFLEACEIATGERAAFLDAACAGDADLKSEIEAMLEADERAGAGRGTAELAGPIDRAAAESTAAPHLHGVPERIGRYRILEKLGEGGMGVVYRAEQTEPVRREVALKIVRAVLDSSAALARFEVERQALALMDHTNVARLFEAGTTEDGRPYFAMELVRGVPITEYCAARKLGLKDRLALFLDVCRGVRHAHRRGVIHRDLKPSNILIAEEEARIVPKVIDFSIAKALGEPGLGTEFRTRTGQVIGTLEYMSPEQAAGRTAAVDTRSDVYALGVVLYELISGRLPHDLQGQPLHEAVRRIVAEPPRTLRGRGTTAAGRLDDEIATIAGKCLEKEPDRRYGSADDLVEDLERYQDSRPIQARPPSTMYQVRKLVGRHRMLFGSMAAALVVLLAFSVTVTIQLGIQSRERQRAEREEKKAQKINSFLQEMLAAADPAKEGGKISIREVLDKAAARMGKGLEGEPEIAAELHRTLGTSYGGLGVLDPARENFEKSLALRKQLHGDDHPETARAHLDLVWFSPMEEGEAHARSALRIFRGRGPQDDQDVAAALTKLADILYKQGKLEDSRKAAEEALAIERRLNDVSDELRGTTLNVLGVTLMDLGLRQEAEPRLREAADLSKAIGGSHSPVHLNALSDLAMCLAILGRHEEALDLGDEILAGRIETLGKDHPMVAISQNNLAAHLMTNGRCAEAEPHQQEALRIWSDGPGKDEVNAATAWNNLGFLRQCRGDYSGAAEAYAESLRLTEKHPETTLARSSRYHNLGVIEGRFGHFEEGVSLLRRSLDSLAADSSDRWGALQQIGSIHIEEGRVEEAEKVLRESLRFLETGIRSDPNSAGKDLYENDTYCLATNTLARTLAAGRKLEEAEDLFRRVRGPLLTSINDADRRRHELKRTADFYDRLRRPADAALYRGALDRLERMVKGKS
jgi:serine/threonine protein kinase/tetratricopeptide (TPR) repeat protein